MPPDVSRERILRGQGLVAEGTLVLLQLASGTDLRKDFRLVRRRRRRRVLFVLGAAGAVAWNGRRYRGRPRVREGGAEVAAEKRACKEER